jgi:hypothetical protein
VPTPSPFICLKWFITDIVPPVAGTWSYGNCVVNNEGVAYVCIEPGTPGRWQQISGGGGGGGSDTDAFFYGG